MSAQQRLNELANFQKKIELKLAEQRWEYLINSINDLLKHNLLTEKDSQIVKNPGYLKSLFENWEKETQFSSRCPDCMIDIIGPRKLMHMHLKKHQERRPLRENDHWNQNFRIHFPRLKYFRI